MRVADARIHNEESSLSIDLSKSGIENMVRTARAPGSIEHKGHTQLKYGQSKQKEGLGTFFNVKCEKRDRDDHSSCVDVDPDWMHASYIEDWDSRRAPIPIGGVGGVGTWYGRL